MKKILLVEDDCGWWDIVKLILGKTYILIFADNYVDAIEILNNNSIELVLLDIDLSKGTLPVKLHKMADTLEDGKVVKNTDGLKVGNYIKTTRHLNNIPIVILSVATDHNIVRECLVFGGAFDYVHKHNSDEIKMVVKRAL